ncbi:hypothetical protein [Pedobacter punctiformis]|uniref:PBCV-specific basic adaptor domain-containing protein n=1 Tax=Pedobacter punctiformis TaxID=3004097 RepID=A0ABT4LC34_9SPHI|nr:hypothetical protein [Pedobacter sp. HCMS5-2]MCZ4245490.1 hypothetical protein [Pedobacter sp. HCMS5-2]
MKKKFIFGLLTLALFGGLTLSVNAQEKKSGVEKAGQAIGKTADKVGKKTAEVAVKGASKVADKTYKGKMAPDGSDVYINGKNEKYYVNKKGAKIWLKASQIRNRPIEKK